MRCSVFLKVSLPMSWTECEQHSDIGPHCQITPLVTGTFLQSDGAKHTYLVHPDHFTLQTPSNIVDNLGLRLSWISAPIFSRTTDFSHELAKCYYSLFQLVKSPICTVFELLRNSFVGDLLNYARPMILGFAEVWSSVILLEIPDSLTM